MTVWLVKVVTEVKMNFRRKMIAFREPIFCSLSATKTHRIFTKPQLLDQLHFINLNTKVSMRNPVQKIKFNYCERCRVEVDGEHQRVLLCPMAR